MTMPWSLRKPIDDSGWTITTVLEYINARISDMELRNQQRFDAQTKSTDSQTHAMEIRQQQRFESQTRAVDAAIVAQRAAIDAALVAADRATAKAEVAADKRFELLNELKAVVVERDSTFITRNEADSRFARNSERTQEMLARMDTFVDRDTVLTQYNLVMTQVNKIAEQQIMSAGKGAGLSSAWVYALGVIAALGTIVSLYLAIK